MSTLRPVLLSVAFALMLSAGAASSSAATATCLPVEPSASATICVAAKPAAGTVVTAKPLEIPGIYRLSIKAAKPGDLNQLVRWTPPEFMAITAITVVENGRCSLAGGGIACVAKPPGRSMTADFAAEVDRGVLPPIMLDLSRSAGQFRVHVPTGSGLRSGDAFNWSPPFGMTITSITHTRGGTCTLVVGSIACRRGTRVLPAKWGLLTVDFRAKITSIDVLRWTPTVPVPSHGGPAFVPEGVDHPLCKAGQTSTPARPCIKP